MPSAARLRQASELMLFLQQRLIPQVGDMIPEKTGLTSLKKNHLTLLKWRILAKVFRMLNSGTSRKTLTAISSRSRCHRARRIQEEPRQCRKVCLDHSKRLIHLLILLVL